MAWSFPQHSKRVVDQAGAALLEAIDIFDLTSYARYMMALNVINNWRSSHSFPLNTFQVGVRKRGAKIDEDAIVAQRIKRLASIELKLRRFPGLRLSQIQDIGGCRIVLSSIGQVDELVLSYIKSDLRHDLSKTDNYVLQPQASGYRGIHLIYKYNSDKSKIYNGLRIELQVRSQLQHAWATAVETVGTFLQQSLKSSMGEQEWLRFFALMGSAIARTEGTEPVQGTPADPNDLYEEIRHFAGQLDVINRLSAFGSALKLFEEANRGDYYIVQLDASQQRVEVSSFPRRELERAQIQYLKVEQAAKENNQDVVLVSVDSIAGLQKAYPNYFLDTRVFIELVRDALARKELVFQRAADLEGELVSASQKLL